MADNGAFKRGEYYPPLPDHNDVLADRILYGGGKYAVPHANSPYGLIPGLSDVALEASQRNDPGIIQFLRSLRMISSGR